MSVSRLKCPHLQWEGGGGEVGELWHQSITARHSIINSNNSIVCDKTVNHTSFCWVFLVDVDEISDEIKKCVWHCETTIFHDTVDTPFDGLIWRQTCGDLSACAVFIFWRKKSDGSKLTIICSSAQKSSIWKKFQLCERYLQFYMGFIHLFIYFLTLEGEIEIFCYKPRLL